MDPWRNHRKGKVSGHVTGHLALYAGGAGQSDSRLIDNSAVWIFHDSRDLSSRGGLCFRASHGKQKKSSGSYTYRPNAIPPYIEGGVDRDRLFITHTQVSLGAKKFLG